MAIWDEVGKKISSVGQQTAKGVSSFLSISKIQDAIGEEQKRMDNFYLQIGHLYFDRYAATAGEPFLSICIGIRECQTRIHDMEIEIKTIKDIKTCSQCGNDCSCGSAFCPSCGGTLLVFPLANEETKRSFCPKCGTSLSSASVFCVKCGEKQR